MSRNDKIRKMADKLPPFPKLKDGRKVQRDSRGNIIYVDHFRELKEIQNRHKDMGKSSQHPDILREWANYSKMVMAYDKAQRRKHQRNFKIVAAVLLGAATIYALLYLFKIIP